MFGNKYVYLTQKFILLSLRILSIILCLSAFAMFLIVKHRARKMSLHHKNPLPSFRSQLPIIICAILQFASSVSIIISWLIRFAHEDSDSEDGSI